MSVKDDDEKATTSTWISPTFGLPIAKVINTDDVGGSRTYPNQWGYGYLQMGAECRQISDKPTRSLLNLDELRRSGALQDRRFLDSTGRTSCLYGDCRLCLVGILCIIILGIYILNLPDLGRVEMVIGSSLCCLPLVIWLLARVRHVHR